MGRALAKPIIFATSAEGDGYRFAPPILRATVPATVSIFRNEEARSLCCFAGATRAPRRKTSKRRSILPRHGVNEMGEKLTTYDPAEDPLSDEAIAVFME